LLFARFLVAWSNRYLSGEIPYCKRNKIRSRARSSARNRKCFDHFVLGQVEFLASRLGRDRPDSSDRKKPIRLLSARSREYRALETMSAIHLPSAWNTETGQPASGASRFAPNHT